MDSSFTFYNPGKLVDNDLELILIKTISPETNPIDFVPVYKFKMILSGTGEKLGNFNFRVENTEDIILYAGHFGYGVLEKYRGHRYAARGCQLLFPLAIKHRINPIWITCNPDNLASRRTCEVAGGKLVEVIDLPIDNDQYQDGDRQKCRYRFDL
ncbi:MAG: GNAT family N-acetyltransferase [Cyanobacteria bacterium P01_G01_bin.67]